MLAGSRFESVSRLSLGFASISAGLLRRDWLAGCCITELNLSGNDLGNEGASTLSCILAEAKWKHLDVSNCAIEAEGAKCIVDAAIDAHLVTLYLDDNPVGDEGAGCVAGALSSSSCCFKAVGIANCRVGDSGIRVLCTALVLTKAPLCLLDMSHNPLSREGRATLEVSSALGMFAAVGSSELTQCCCCAGCTPCEAWDHTCQACSYNLHSTDASSDSRERS